MSFLYFNIMWHATISDWSIWFFVLSEVIQQTKKRTKEEGCEYMHVAGEVGGNDSTRSCTTSKKKIRQESS